MTRSVCVHVTGDFPDPFGDAKTPVIRSLVDLVADRFDQQVISLNRIPPGNRFAEQPFAYGTAVRYPAPGLGLYHRTMLDRLGDRLASLIAHGGSPDLVVGHKLTIEGLAVARAAKVLEVPYALTVQGNTDLKIIAARPDLRRRFAQVFHGAATVFALAPWSLAAVERRLGKRAGPTILLPAPIDRATPAAPADGDGTLVSAFHLRGWRDKNLAGMAAALRTLGDAAPVLEIIGGGPSDVVARCRRAIGGAPSCVLAGPLSRDELHDRMHRASGFVLPSLRESFGLVFVEALFAGLPIVYPAGAAVDGWFDGLPFAIRIDARDPAAIGAAMQRLIREERTLKAALADWQGSAQARRFMRPAIATAFADGLDAAIAQ